MTAFYIARQPILRATGETYGYELLFRSSESNAYEAGIDGNAATSNVLYNAIVEIGLQSIVGNGQAFINLTNRFLEAPELLDLLPTGRCVLEVLETVNVNDAVVSGVQALREMGHTIALDDFVNDSRFERLMPFADIVKYDITQHSMEELREYRNNDDAAGRRSLVERVETHEEFDILRDIGFDYYQGYFFAKPRIMSGSKLPQNRVALMQLMAEINNPDSTIEELAEIVGRDVSLGVRTLNYVNSPMNGLRAEVTSIKHATVLLGREIIRNWVTLLIMSQMDDKPSELMKLALTRARFCHTLAARKGLDGSRYFTLGLLSLLDVFLNQPLAEVLETVTVCDDMREELLSRDGVGGRFLHLSESFENSGLNNTVSTEELENGKLYQAAATWAEETLGLLH